MKRLAQSVRAALHRHHGQHRMDDEWQSLAGSEKEIDGLEILMHDQTLMPEKQNLASPNDHERIPCLVRETEALCSSYASACERMLW